MAKYYLVRGFRVPFFHNNESFGCQFSASNKSKLNNYKKQRIIPPSNYTLIKITPRIEVKIVYCNVDVGFFLLKAPSRREAYFLANAIRGFYGIFYGWLPPSDEDTYFLYEIGKIPQSSWLERDLLDSLWPHYYATDIFVKTSLSSIVVIDNQSLDGLSEFLENIYCHDFIVESMNHLMESRRIYWGHMTPSYYHFHYRRDRPLKKKWEIEKEYLEMRYKYESSFVASFKGIESLLDKNGFKKREIRKLLKWFDCPKISYDEYYLRRHEIFLGLKKKIKYGELIEHFLKIRNVVAAHNNKRPPREFNLSQDNVIEIQLFLQNILTLKLNWLIDRAAYRYGSEAADSGEKPDKRIATDPGPA